MASPFQSSVLRKHLSALDGLACRQAYDRLQAHFGDRETQDRILGLKEEEYQYGFLEDLFSTVLGYTLKPKAGYDLVAEKKNLANSKKVDGAVLNASEEVHAVIELKGTDTIDLNRVEAQAFGYLNAHPTCRYAVTSNFARLRFYLGDTTAYLEWDLFNLPFQHTTQPDFRLLWLCLQRDNLLADLPMRVREESTVKEEEITKELYRDYSAFKRELFGHLRQNAPPRDALRLYQLTQKLLDRLLFVFFGEDKGLLPPNTASKPIGDFDKLREIDQDQPLYTLLTKYFGYIDAGVQRKDFNIPAYNGGLFAPDAELDALRIPDPLLRKHLLKLTAYKFDSEVDVNILGHIFEHSLNEIEEVQAELRGEALDKSKTRRKKDGVYYTPRYITKYIVENTVGRLCIEKRAELGIDEQDYARGRKRRRKATLDALRQNLETYRDWLLDLKICDPACGSGAFLNEALNFLIAEHENVSELERQLFDASIRFEAGPAILENNLYGVDINDEAVEIARLSLWLRTAERGRKLTNLNDRIKVGNSLIDDPKVAGEKAFVWAEEFPEVFGEGSRGGFDVVIGNPPYGAKLTTAAIAYFRTYYRSLIGHAEVYYLFVERAILTLQNKNATFGFIIPNSWITNKYAEGMRRLLLNKQHIERIINLKGEGVFTDANVETSIIISKAFKSVSVRDCMVGTSIEGLYIYNKSNWNSNDRSIITFDENESVTKILDKVKLSGMRLDSVLDVSNGIKPYQAGYGKTLAGEPLTSVDVKMRPFHSDKKLNNSYQPEVKGGSVNRYSIDNEGHSYILWGDWLMSPKSEHFFDQKKILVRQIVNDYILCAIDEDKLYADQSLYCITHYPGQGELPQLEEACAVLNSRLL